MAAAAMGETRLKSGAQNSVGPPHGAQGKLKNLGHLVLASQGQKQKSKSAREGPTSISDFLICSSLSYLSIIHIDIIANVICAFQYGKLGASV